MHTLVAVAVVVVGTVASTAHARGTERAAVDGRPARVIVDGLDADVVIESASAEVFESRDTALVRLTIVLASRRDDAVGRVGLSMPNDARIVAMSYTQGGEQVVATPRPALEAAQHFERSQGRRVDPALLEWTSAPRFGQSNYRLSVFPMSWFERATAVVSIAMPRFDRLIIDAQHRSTFEGGESPVPTQADLALAKQPSAVEAKTSLYAVPATLPVARPAIRAVVATTSGKLRTCFGRDAVTPVDAVVRFAIDAAGFPIDPEVTGVSRAMRTCITDIAYTWRFPTNLATSDAIAYPLHFSP